VLAAGLLGTSTQGLSQDAPDEVIIKLERTSCFGSCPVYTVTLDARGGVTWLGEKFVRVEGQRTDRVQPSRIAALLTTADRIGFFNLSDHYRTIRNPDGSETMVTDLPTTFVSITRGGRTKRVEDYIGAPSGLKDLEQQIDETARTKRWIRLDAQTLQDMVRAGQAPTADERAEYLGNALMNDDVDVVKGLLELGADPNSYRGTSTPPLIMVRSAAAARALIEAGAIATTRNQNEFSALYRATYLAPDVAEVLLKAGVPVDEPVDSSQVTALWHAACRGNVGVVSVLLAAGANPAVSSNGLSALECAQRGREDARSRRPSPFDEKQPFVEDFDGVIARLQSALISRKPK
jgi:hypothetical protein